MMQVLMYMQHSESRLKNNHSVDTVGKTLVLHYHNSKAHLSVIVNKTLKMCLLNYISVCTN